MTLRFASSVMSLRDRLRPSWGDTAPQKVRSEAEAAALLAARRGRTAIAPPPNAGRTVASVLRLLRRETALGLRELQRRWSEIAGPPFADKTEPEKLAGGVLTLRAPGALAPLLQQQAPLLIERLKLAGASVTSIKIVQRAPVRAQSGNIGPLRRDLSPIEEATLVDTLSPVADPKLRAALLRLGKAVGGQ